MLSPLLRANRSRLTLTVIAVVTAVVAAVACGGTGDDATSPKSDPTSAGGTASVPGAAAPGAGGGATVTSATGLPCDVDAVLKAHCQTCHASQPQFGASVPLVTWDDLQKPAPGANAGKKVYELLQSRIHDDARPMPPSPQPRLDAKDAATVDTWIAAGAKASAATCTGAAAPDGVKPLSCTPDTVLKATKPFVMQPGSALDQYTCFGVDIDVQKKRHVTALAPHVDNKQIVHHILLFQTNTAESTEPFPCEAFGSAAWKLVAGWAPGGTNLELPPEAGFPENVGTTHWVVQVHYNNAKAQTGTDQSGYELCTTETLRPNDAGVLAFGSTSFSIPPRSTTTVRCDYPLGPQFANVKLFNASPHMHTRGAALSTERLPGGTGTPETILDQKAFSFEAQANYPITKSVAPGDVMRTRCTWKNPGDTAIGFGEGTSDEMCFDFIGYYPNIPDQAPFGIPIFTWITPSANATCAAE
jgi:copper type II ascorbate-dependent monooxygenase-like protein